MNHYSIGEACISSVCVKESGFMDYRFAAYKAAEELGFKVIRNPEDTGITQNRFRNILKQDTPVFILLVGDVKSDVVADECRLALERGLPIFVFLKTKHNDGDSSKSNDNLKPIYVDGEKSISVETQQIMNDISKITYNSDCALFASCEELYEAIKYRLNDYIEKRIRLSPKIQYNRGSTYYYAYEQVLAAKKRIVLSQKTSGLILGPRRGNTFERRTYDALFKWIEEKDDGMQFTHLFCLEDTIEEMKNKDKKADYDIEAAKVKLCGLLSKVRNKHGGTEDPNFSFRSIKKEKNENAQSIAHLITDTGFQLVLPIAGDVFNLILPYYFTPEEQLMKIITRIHTRTYVRYDDIEKLYEDIETGRQV